MKRMLIVAAVLVVAFLALIPRASQRPPESGAERLHRIEASCRREYSDPDAVQRCKADVVANEFVTDRRERQERASRY